MRYITFLCLVLTGEGAPRGRRQDPPALLGIGRPRQTAGRVPDALRTFEPVPGKGDKKTSNVLGCIRPAGPPIHRSEHYIIRLTIHALGPVVGSVGGGCDVSVGVGVGPVVGVSVAGFAVFLLVELQL